MIKINTKKYEIEEEIEVVDENGVTLDKFTMQITPEELKEIEKIILNEEGIKLTKELEKLEKKNASEEEIEKKQKEYLELIEKCQQRFEEIIFKDRLESFKKNVGEYYFEETISCAFDFFWNTFISKRMKRVDTMRSDLMKITRK